MKKTIKQQWASFLAILARRGRKILNATFALMASGILGAATFLISTDLILAICVTITAYKLFTSTSLEWDITYLALLAGGISLAITHNWYVSVIITIGTAIIWYTLFARLIPDAAKQKKWLTHVNLNEYLVIQTGDNMLNRYIGWAQRWVVPHGSTSTPGHRAAATELAVYMPHPKTGKITRRDTASLLAAFDLHGLVSLYIVQRTGAVWVGIPEVTNVKKFKMDFKVFKDGKEMPKHYAGAEAATSIFDSFTYLFIARSLETANTAKVTIYALVTLTADNLHTPSYIALPAGVFVNKAEETFIDKVRVHAAKTDFGELLQERHSRLGDMSPEAVKEYHQEVQAVAADAKATLYEMLMSEEANLDFITSSGFFVTDIQIGDITLDGNKEYAESLLLPSIAKKKGEAALIDQQYLTEKAKEEAKTAHFKRVAELEIQMVPIDASEKYVENVIEKIKDNPDALAALKVKEISGMKNLQALGGDVSQLLTPRPVTGSQPKNQGGEV